MRGIFTEPFRPAGCEECRNPAALGFDFTMAFQPIMDLETMRPFAYEALVRGLNGEGAGFVLGQVDDGNRYRFDQACRVKAIELAAGLGMHRIASCHLSINFLPNAIYRPETCIRSTLEACARFGFPSDRLMFEVTEGERVEDGPHLVGIFNDYRKRGFLTAIDDFGAGYAGLNLLATFQPHVLKLDMELTRDIDGSAVRQAIVAGIALTAGKLNITLVAEGVETAGERDTLHALGIKYQQGYLFARPAVGALPLA
ncbi:EAL domain-containing protein [Noviherbaspirillum denitrificans]|uniref:Diguanylate phosphodiesterase n=1 Tax=Noviherbaspirillum denitrificans TaxID=1968433 RepID=A0A254TAC5_9BURK|nr:EAL domain-containing protein [Noviherbaspirillum denitrificans]OWW19600.1 diguanylate phosphodiesterase [Noviherbaspirillum denitrificans]